MRSLRTTGLGSFVPFAQWPELTHVNRTNSAVVHTIIVPSAATSTDVTAPTLCESMTQEAFSDCMM